MARRFTSRPRGRTEARKSLWIGITPTITTSVTGGVITNALNAAALALRPFTIVRTHLQFYAHSDQAATSETYGGAVGMAVVSDQALAVGVTAIPTPITDLGSDLFFVHQMYWGEAHLFSAIGVEDLTGQGNGWTVDSKAMRKVTDDQDLAIVLESTSGIIGEGSIVAMMGRMLIKLH